MKNRNWRFLLLFLGSITIYGCKKENYSVQLPVLTTTDIIDISETGATSGGNVTNDGGGSITYRGVCWSTNINPTISNYLTLNGTGIGSFSSKLTGLSPETKYYIRAYAANNAGTAYGNELIFTTPSAATTVTDVDGNVYNTVIIGTQTWMVENLRTTKFYDHTDIPNITDSQKWPDLVTPAFCWHNNDVSNKVPFGALYNFYSVNTGKLAPKGWHIPTDNEWKQLEMYLGMSQSDADAFYLRGVHIGSKLAGILGYWNVGELANDAAFNTSGFEALPSGYLSSGSFSGLGFVTSFWSATEVGSSQACSRYLVYNYSGVVREWISNKYGYSVRCVKD